MSSLAASRADNFYHPPEWDPQKIARDKYQGSKGSNQWEQYGVIRFEMPYNIWCDGCKKHIRKGTRFNAKKDTVGAYFSTKIYAFTMKCACCPQKIVIETDPKACDYVVASGGRQKIETYTEADAEVEHLSTEETKIKLATDPFYRRAQPPLPRLSIRCSPCAPPPPSAPAVGELNLQDNLQDALKRTWSGQGHCSPSRQVFRQGSRRGGAAD